MKVHFDITAAMMDRSLVQGVADLITSLNTPSFETELANLVAAATGFDSMVMVALFERGGIRPLFNNLSQADLVRTLEPYLAGAYLIDPWYNMALAGAPNGLYRLADIAPDDFERSDYYREYYADIGLHDECVLLVKLSAGAWALLSFGARVGPARSESLERLQQIAPCLVALCERQWSNLAIHDAPEVSLESLCLAKGLSKREVEVIGLLLRGCSNKLIAREMDISPETVKVYRKRINKKLGTSSAREVFASFFSSPSSGVAPGHAA